MIRDWHLQYAIHGIVDASGMCCLQICRYSDSLSKDRTPIPVEPGARIRLPAADDSTEAVHVDYHVGFVIFHIGATVTCGYYQAALSRPRGDACAGTITWEYVVCDDRRVPRVATSRDHKLIRENSYLVGLIKS